MPRGTWNRRDDTTDHTTDPEWVEFVWVSSEQSSEDPS